MALVQVRNVPDETVARLKAQARAKGLTMAAYIRGELEKLAEKPTNAEIIDELRRERAAHPEWRRPTREEVVAAVRRTRDA